MGARRTEELARGDEAFAMRLVARTLQQFGGLTDPADLESFLAPPASTGDERWDTLLAAAVARACRPRGLAAPAWTDRPPLATWWFPLVGHPSLLARAFQRTPIELAARGIWLEASALEAV